MFADTFCIKIVLKETHSSAKTGIWLFFSFSPTLQQQDSTDR